MLKAATFFVIKIARIRHHPTPHPQTNPLGYTGTDPSDLVESVPRQVALISEGGRGATTLSILGNSHSTPIPTLTRRLNNLLVIYNSISTIIMALIAISIIGATRATWKKLFAASSTMKHGAILLRHSNRSSSLTSLTSPSPPEMPLNQPLALLLHQPLGALPSPPMSIVHEHSSQSYRLFSGPLTSRSPMSSSMMVTPMLWGANGNNTNVMANYFPVGLKPL